MSDIAEPESLPRVFSIDRVKPIASSYRLSNVDTLRGIAALAVVLHHIYLQFYLGFFGPYIDELLLWAGSWGVSLFFVLSGFCIHLPHARRKALASSHAPRLQIGSFLAQRFLRIAPPYWFAIVLSLAASSIMETGLIKACGWSSVFAHMVGVHGLVPDMLHGLNGVFWTIGIEIQFYIFYLLFADKRFRLSILFMFIIIGVFIYGCASVLFKSDDPWREIGQHFFLVLFWQWYAGALLAETYASRPLLSSINRHYVHGARFFAIIASLGLAFSDPVIVGLHIRFWLLPITNLAILALFLVPCSDTSGRLSRMGTRLGDVSYSLYLFHPLAIWSVLYLMLQIDLLPFSFCGVLALLLAISFAAISYAAIERPFLQFRKSLRSGSLVCR